MFTHDDSSDKPDTRTRILAATRRLMEDRGVARVRIDAVAKEAGLSGGALYRHFKGREELILAVILESLPREMPLGDVPAEATDVPAALSAMLTDVYEHEKRMAAVAVTLLADEDLSERFREMLVHAPGGPENFTAALAAALQSYREAGAISPETDVHAAAALVQARCFHHAVMDRLHGPRAALGTAPDVVQELVAILARGLTTR